MKMKDSGIAWIGEIPEEWQIHRIKVNFQIITGNGFSPQLQGMIGEQYPMYKASDISYSGKYIYTATNSVSERVAKEQHFNIIPSGSILFAKVGEAMKKNNRAINAIPCCIDNNCQAMLPHNINTDYGYYIFSIIDLNEFDNGGTVPCINNQKLRSYFIPYPSVNEQQHIADYLDRKCSQIDAIIARQQEVIEKLKAYKLSVITEAVTKGLNPHAPMKDSGFDFIGSIPATWEICRLRNIGTLQNGISKGGEFFGHGFPFVSYSDVYRNFSLPVHIAGLIDSSDEERKKYSVKAGDIFFTRTSETIEEVGFSSICEVTIPNATFAGFLIRVRPYTDNLLSKFAKYYFRSNHHRYFLVKQMNLVTRASLGQDLLKSMPVLVPPKEEQIRIAVYLDKKCGAIDSSIKYKQRVIEQLTAYKKSLIYEVVTGKKEV